jgi:cation diffusion facilitator family transporter
MSAPLRQALALSIGAAVLTAALKGTAYALTGSAGLLSDAMESLTNLAAAGAAYLAVRYAAKPVDASHTYGHEKIEYFSSGFEGGLILVASGGIGWYAIDRLLYPQPLQPLGLGLLLSFVSAAINGAVAVVLLRVGRRHGSIVLEADGQHLLTDVWTSVVVGAGLGLVWLTGLEWLDPLLALVVAGNILWTAFRLMRDSFNGLMDHALPPADVERVRACIREHIGEGMDYHALRTRQAGATRFVDFHLLVDGDAPVRDAHQAGERVEAALREMLPGAEVVVHIEPIDEVESYRDSALVALEGKAPGGDGLQEPRP